MQVIYGTGLASNIQLTAQKRLIRPVYAQTQGFPYAALLDPSLRNSDQTFRVPVGGDTVPFTRTAGAGGNAFTLNGSIVPGTVMTKTTGEYAALHPGGTAAAVQPWGLLGQWIGGTFDNLGLNNQIGIWMGPDSVYELLAPAWNDTGLQAALTANASTGVQTLLYAGTDSRLVYNGSPGSAVAIARVIDRPSAARLLIQLVI